MDRYAYRACLVGNGTGNCLPYPPCCICGEFISLAVVEFVNGFEKTEVTLLNEVKEEHTAVDVSF